MANKVVFRLDDHPNTHPESKRRNKSRKLATRDRGMKKCQFSSLMHFSHGIPRRTHIRKKKKKQVLIMLIWLLLLHCITAIGLLRSSLTRLPHRSNSWEIVFSSRICNLNCGSQLNMHLNLKRNGQPSQQSREPRPSPRVP